MGSAGRLALVARRFTTSAVRRSAHGEPENFPGANMPFGINNRYRLTLNFALFFGSGFALPYLILRHQLLKK